MMGREISPSSRLLKQSASIVLASFRPSTYHEGAPRAFTRCGLAGQPVGAVCERVVTTNNQRDRRLLFAVGWAVSGSSGQECLG